MAARATGNTGKAAAKPATTKQGTEGGQTGGRKPKGVTSETVNNAPVVGEDDPEDEVERLIPAAEEAQEEVNEANEGLDKDKPGWMRQRDADKERDNFPPGNNRDDRPARELSKDGDFNRNHNENRTGS